MRQQLLSAARMLLVLTLLTGVLYPVSMTVLAQLLFPQQANGRLLTVNDQVVGSALIGQSTADMGYFWSRPSAVGYMQGSTLAEPGTSGATNLSSTSADLAQEVAQREAAFRQAHNLPPDVAIPVEMLFASGSGLDPHISPQAARLQVGRVAQARHLPPEQVAALVEAHIEGPQIGFLGQPRVNVLVLNLALDELQ